MGFTIANATINNKKCIPVLEHSKVYSQRSSSQVWVNSSNSFGGIFLIKTFLLLAFLSDFFFKTLF